MTDYPLSIPASEAERLIAAGNPDAALLYLCLKTGRTPDAAQTQCAMSAERAQLALALLRQLGLYEPPQEQKKLDASQPPVYTEQDVLRETASNPEFPAIVGETQRRLGRLLSNEELKTLLGIYRYLGLAPEVISILINYCIESQRVRGISRAPSLRMIEREAYRWADQGVDTMERAAVYMQTQLKRRSALSRVKHILGVEDRRLTPSEEKLALSWLEWGFGEEEIALAYEKTCMNTGGLKWPYLNSILKSWHEQGLTTLADIARGDRAPAAKPAAARPGYGAQHHNDELTELERAAVQRLLNKEE